MENPNPNSNLWLFWAHMSDLIFFLFLEKDLAIVFFTCLDSKLSSQVPQLWEAYLERFADMNEDIRKICIQHISDFLVQQASNISKITPNTSILSHGAVISTTGNNSFQLIEQIIEQVKNRSLDPDESLRFEVVQEILKAIRIDTDLITGDLLNILQKRTLDVKIKIRKAALQGLAQLYKKVRIKHIMFCFNLFLFILIVFIHSLPLHSSS